MAKLIPKIAVLAVGDELLNGERADTNTRRIAQALEAKGFHLRESRAVPDDEDYIAEALSELAERRTVVIVTGGLGATDDDRTARAAAKALRRPQVLNEEALRQIHDFIRRSGREMHPRNDKQALLPQKAQLIVNPSGSAPGFRLQQDEKNFFFLPGVPAEMELMLEQSVLPLLEESYASTLFCERVFTLLGIAEPRAEAQVLEAGLPEGVELGFGVDVPLVFLKLRARGETAETLLDRAEPAVLRAVGDYLVARGMERPAETVARLLTEQEKTLSVAESCTGGMICALLTAIPGASAFLERGAVTYANSAKTSWLKIPVHLLDQHGAVSEMTARLMARGIRRAAHTDFGLAVTGIAGPDGGSAEKPVGLVYIALATAAGERVERHLFKGDRETIRRQSASYALDLIRQQLMAPLELEGVDD